MSNNLKTSRPKGQNKNKQPIRRSAKRDQITPMRKQLDENIEASTIALLSAHDLLLPRAMPTHVVRTCTHLVLPISGVEQAQVWVEPWDVDYPIKVVTVRETGVNNTYTQAAGTYNLAKPDSNFTEFASNIKHAFHPTDFLFNSEPLPFVEVNIQLPYLVSTEVLDGTNSLLCDVEATAVAFRGPLVSATIVIDVNYSSPILTTNCLSFVLHGFDANDNLVSTATASTISLGANSIRHTLTAGSLIGQFFMFQWVPQSALYNTVVSVTYGVAQIVISNAIYDLSKFRPMNIEQNWQNLVDSSLKYSFTACSVVMRNTASAINNGGNVASALFPSRSIILGDPAATFTKISNLRYNAYEGKLKDGAHVSYLPDDISQYFFKDFSSSFDAPIPCITAIAPQGDTDNELSIQIEISMCFEFLSSDQSRTFLVSPGHSQLLECIIRAIVLATAKGEDYNLAGCNPDHIKRIKNIAKHVASDPVVRQHAVSALKTMGSLAAKVAPMLFSLV